MSLEQKKRPGTTCAANPNRKSAPQRTQSKRLATLAEAAEYLQISPRTIRRRIADGSLTGYRLGSRIIRVDLAEVDSLMRPIATVSGATHD